MSNETKTVPVEPTEAMLESGLIALSDSGVEGNDEERLNDAKACYKAMLEAAPAPDDELARLESVNNRLCVVSQQLYDANNTIKAIRELPDKWRKYSFDNPEAAEYMDSADCADELEALLPEE